jgi:uncharacterized protein involved in type VI secretion and phage assembly
MNESPVDPSALGQSADANQVRCSLISDAAPDTFSVTDFELVAALNRPYRLRADIVAEHRTTDLRELLGRDATLTLDRGAWQ